MNLQLGKTGRQTDKQQTHTHMQENEQTNRETDSLMEDWETHRKTGRKAVRYSDETSNLHFGILWTRRRTGEKACRWAGRLAAPPSLMCCSRSRSWCRRCTGPWAARHPHCSGCLCSRRPRSRTLSPVPRDTVRPSCTNSIFPRATWRVRSPRIDVNRGLH